MVLPLKLLLTFGLMVLSIISLPQMFKIAGKQGTGDYPLFFLWVVTLIPSIIQFILHFKLSSGKVDLFLIFAILNTVGTFMLAGLSAYMYFWSRMTKK